MIVIDKMITHILDASSNVLICSDTCMQESDEQCLAMIEAKLSKVFTSNQRKVGHFKQGSTIQHLLEEYRASLLSFEAMSKKMATHIFQAKMKCALFEASDLIIAEVVYEERRYLIGLDNCYSENLTHHTKQIGEETQNEMIAYKTLISNSLVKKDYAFMIEFSDESVSSVESKVDIEAQKRYFYGDIVLLCENKPSYKDALKSVNKACEQVVQQYDLKEIEVMPKMKQIIKESVEAQEDISIEEVAQVLFAQKPLAKQQFKEEVKNNGVRDHIAVEHMKSTKSEKVQKIRTDKGIEIIIPVDYMNSTDYIEFTTLHDGTISIQLKNINRIVSK